MAYLAPIHQPSAVRHAIKLEFLAPDEDCLAVAKANRLEFYLVTPDGLSLSHSKTVYGGITMLEKLRPASSETDHLFVGTDRSAYFTLSWDANTKQIQTQSSYVDLAEKSARDSQTGDRCHIDSSRRFMTLELYEGVITVIPIAHKAGKSGSPEVGTLTEPIPARIKDMFIRSSTFFETRLRDAKDEKPKLALLYEDTMGKIRLKVRSLSYMPGIRDTGTVDLNEGALPLSQEFELGASHLIPVPEPACGILVLGETSITYYEHSSGDFLQRPLKEATIFVTWERIDQQRFVLADEYGTLYLLMLELDRDLAVSGWRLDQIGKTTRASVLVYLDSGNIFVGSHQGDSQVISIKPQSMDVIQTLPGIGPILDFAIMDLGSRNTEGQGNEYSSGQARLVTGSGAYNDGSLRSVRSGVGLEQLGMLGDMENITNMFCLKSHPSTRSLDTLIVSFIDETRMFSFSSNGEIEEQAIYGDFSLESETLAATNVADGRLLQITGSMVQLFEPEKCSAVAQWKPPGELTITAVSHNDNNVCVVAGGTILTVLNTSGNLEQVAQRSFENEKQVACINLSTSNQSICIIGFWDSAAISILDLRTLTTISTEDTAAGAGSIPRSLLLVQVLENQPPTLFIAIADGNVITYAVDQETATLSGRSSVMLGTQEASLRALPRGDGLYSVFAICEHPSLIYGSEGRIVYSAITAEEASCVCPFDSEAYPGAIAIATPKDLKLAIVDEERSTHVQALPVGETVRRIAHSTELKAFGLGTILRTLENGVEHIQSHFKLTDEIVFNVLDTFKLNENELVESVIRCHLDDGSGTGSTAERFVVGTAYLDDDRANGIRGRIIVLEVTEDRVIKEVAERAVKGACRCLATVNGKIVAALIKTVVVFTFIAGATSHFKIAATFRTATAPIDLTVTSTNIIAVADVMKSVSLVQYTAGDVDTPDTLIEVARHFQTSWSTAVAHIDDSTYLQSDAQGNLVVLSRDGKSEFAEDRRRLRVVCEMSLGEMVNRIRVLSPGGTVAVAATGDPPVVPRAFLATVSGSIYMFGVIAPSKLDLLLRLQEQLAQLVRAPGDVPFNKYRAFRTEVREADEPYRFVDGELVERFLELDAAVQEEIVRGVGLPGWDGEQVRGLVEGLRRLR